MPLTCVIRIFRTLPLSENEEFIIGVKVINTESSSKVKTTENGYSVSSSPVFDENVIDYEEALTNEHMYVFKGKFFKKDKENLEKNRS